MLVDTPLMYGGLHQIMLRFRFLDGMFSLILLSYLSLTEQIAFSSAALHVGAALQKYEKKHWQPTLSPLHKLSSNAHEIFYFFHIFSDTKEYVQT